ncbi:hypothetical protein SCA6_009088 [Theobroma cacao]
MACLMGARMWGICGRFEMYKSQDLSLHVSLAQQLCNVLPQKWLNLYEFGLCGVKPIHVRETWLMSPRDAQPIASFTGSTKRVINGFILFKEMFECVCVINIDVMVEGCERDDLTQNPRRRGMHLCIQS